MSELLLDVYERIRDRSGLVRDQEPDVFFLEDAAIRALPTSVVDAGRYGDSIIVEFTSNAADAKAAALNVSAYHALLDQDSDEVGDDVNDAVDSTASQSMSTSLLGAIDRYRQSVEGLQPLVPTSAAKSHLDNTIGVPLAQAAEESTAAALSGTLFDQIGTLVVARGAAARHRENLLLISFIIALLLVVALVSMDIWSMRGRRSGRPKRSFGGFGDPTTETTGSSSHWGPDNTPDRLSTRERAGAPQ